LRNLKLPHLKLKTQNVGAHGGLIPENLPSAEDVQKVEQRLTTEEKKVLKK
jgi:hypothetical protein